MAIYLGRRRQGDLLQFSSQYFLTRVSYGHLYTAVIDPFKSKVGARYPARYGRSNPHIQAADDAERPARADLLMEGAIIEESMTDDELSIARECDALNQCKYSPLPNIESIQPETGLQGANPCLSTLNING